MKKYVKLLMESLFDDNSDFLDNDKEISQGIKNFVKANSLTECNSVDEINSYIIDKYDIINKLIPFVEYVADNFGFVDDRKISKYFLNHKGADMSLSYWLSTDKRIFLTVNPFNLKFHIDADLEYTDVNKTELVENIYIQDDNNHIKVYWKMIRHSNIKLAKRLDAYILHCNDAYNKTKYDELQNLVSYVVSELLRTKRLYEEISCTGKVYPVTQKDIDRMNKAIDRDDFTGFNAIKDKKKLIARCAASLVIYGKFQNSYLQEYLNRFLDMTDDTVLEIITGKRNRDNYYYYKQTTGVMHKLMSFYDTHIKDVIASYNAYIAKTGENE